MKRQKMPRHIKISTRISIVTALLYLMIAVVSFSIITFSVDRILKTRKNRDLALRTVSLLSDIYAAEKSEEWRRVRNRSESNLYNGNLYHREDGDYFSFVIRPAGNSSESRAETEKMPRETIETARKTEISPAQFSIEKDVVRFQAPEKDIRLVITETVNETSKSSVLTENIGYFCVPLSENRFLISAYRSEKDEYFKKQILDLIIFVFFVGIGILSIFSKPPWSRSSSWQTRRRKLILPKRRKD